MFKIESMRDTNSPWIPEGAKNTELNSLAFQMIRIKTVRASFRIQNKRRKL